MREVYTGMDPKEIESEYLNGVYNEIANTLGIEAAVKLYSTYRGQQITFPVNLFTSEFIASRIVAEYDGKTVITFSGTVTDPNSGEAVPFERSYQYDFILTDKINK